MQREIGALWERDSKKGNHYLQGVIDTGEKEIKIVCFLNDKKYGQQPDWRIYESRPLNGD